MEKRFVIFIVLTMLILTGHVFLQSLIAPPRPPAEAGKSNLPNGESGQLNPADPIVGGEVAPALSGSNSDAVATDREPKAALSQTVAELASQPAAENTAKHQWLAMGDYGGKAGPLLATFNSRGAGLERVELVERLPNGEFKYQNLENKSGYLGHLALTPEATGGCRVNVVGAGTPAASATSDSAGMVAGLQVGDVIKAIVLDGSTEVELLMPEDLERFLSETEPGDSVGLMVARDAAATSRFTVELAVRPLQIIQPEPLEADELEPHPASLLLSLASIDGATVASKLAGNLSPREGIWQATQLEGDRPGIEFRFPLGPAELESIGREGNLELVKRFWLGSRSDDEIRRDHHLEIEIEIANRGPSEQRIQYRLEGPNGLPTEGWWYSYKTHPDMFYAAGARDILYLPQGAVKPELVGCSAIYKKASQHPENPETPLLNDSSSQVALNYLAVDTQYFVSCLSPMSEESTFSRADATLVGKLKAKRLQKTSNVSFELESTALTIPAGASIAERFELFVGPKQPELLASYGLQETIYYGWFGAVARPLSWVLHFFYDLVGNYGVAIVMLTILVRGGMFPLSRKAAKNAAMMQELAPEMKAITEKYKKDMEKRAKAQQELFRRNNYNPLGGCWVMFLQLPIFIGLYRSLSVDIELRQASLIPGWDWCTNLAGPDQLFFWGDYAFMGLFEKTGMLGPYFNILPLGTVALFLIQQKMFTPPATDDQTRMQLQVMKFMTLFIGIMFFKVASGLCLYFIASSLWGIAERKLLPKKNIKSNDEPEKLPESKPRAATRSVPNGASQKNGGKSKRKAKKRS